MDVLECTDVLSITSDTTNHQSQHTFYYLMEVMGLHFSSHILFPVFFFAQSHIGWSSLEGSCKHLAGWFRSQGLFDPRRVLFMSPALGTLCSPCAVAKGKWGKRIWKLSTKPLLLLRTLECFSERPVMVIACGGAQGVLLVDAQMCNCLP